MKKIIFALLFLCLAASSVFALTPKEVITKSMEVSWQGRESEAGRQNQVAFIIESNEQTIGSRGNETKKSIKVIDKDKLRQDFITYSGNKPTSGSSTIWTKEGVWLTTGYTVKEDGKIVYSYKFLPSASKDKNVENKNVGGQYDSSQIQALSKLLGADSAVFVTGDPKSNNFYVIEGTGIGGAIFRFYIDKSNYTLSESVTIMKGDRMINKKYSDDPKYAEAIKMMGSKMDITITQKYSDYRKVLGKYYPYRVETYGGSKGYESNTVEEITSFKIVPIQDVKSYFVVQSEQESKSRNR